MSEGVIDFRERLERIRRAKPDAADRLAHGGGGPHDPGMDARLTAVEQRLDRLEGKVDGLDARLRGVETAVSGVSAKLDLLSAGIVGKIPSWWQIPAASVSTVVLLSMLLAGAQKLHVLGL
jgi:hypothetical protein